MSALLRALGAIGFLCLSPAFADEIKPVNVPCKPVSEMTDVGKYRRLTRDEWEAARVMFFLAPNTPASLPPGDSALLYEQDDGSASLVFLDEDEACAPMRLLKDGLALLAQIKAGVVTHPPGRM